MDFDGLIPEGSKKRKQSKNAFFFFMKERKEELEETGVYFAKGYKDVAEYVSSEWKGKSAADREKYKKKAMEYKRSVAGKRSTAPPVIPNAPSLWVISNGQSKNVGKNIVMKLVDQNDVKVMPIVIINFNQYWEHVVADQNGITRTLAIPAEVGMNAFSLKDGVFDNFSTLIDPGHLRDGKFCKYKVMTEVKKNAKAKCLPIPDYCDELQNYNNIVNRIEQFVNLHSKSYFGELFVFCRDQEAGTVEACFTYLYRYSGKHRQISVLSLDTLMMLISQKGNSLKNSGDSENSLDATLSSLTLEEQEELSSAIEKKDEVYGGIIVYPTPSIQEGIFNRESDVEHLLSTLNLAFFGELACHYHMEWNDTVHFCSQTKVNRYAFGLLDVLVRKFSVAPKLGRHYPMLNDLKAEMLAHRTMLKKWAIGNPTYILFEEISKMCEFEDDSSESEGEDVKFK